MEREADLRNCDEATRFIESIQDPITRNLVNMTFAHLVKHVYIDPREAPGAGFDMAFLMRALEGFFAEHHILRATLDGERVGAMFDEDLADAPLAGTRPTT